MKKLILIIATFLMLTGCGWYERVAGTVTGGGYNICVDGVAYLQFTSGVSVKYLPDGEIATCK